MESCSLYAARPLPSSSSLWHSLKKPKPFSHVSISSSTCRHSPLSSTVLLRATLKNPKGFGPNSRKKSRKPDKKPRNEEEEEDDDDEEEEEEQETREEGVIPEVVTNRMIGRMGLSVGIPLSIGLLFFPFFYYLKVGLKIDVPNWVPFIVSFIFFGSALAGISYAIVSTSWDPLREGSFLGWNEAQKNWPVFWESLRDRPAKTK